MEYRIYENGNGKVLELEDKRQLPLKINHDGLSWGDIIIQDEHGQDCCENVYVDWLGNDSGKKKLGNYSFLKIEAVEEYGLRIHYGQQNRPARVFNIPAYNEQNGWYSNELQIVISNDDFRLWWDVTGITEDIER